MKKYFLLLSLLWYPFWVAAQWSVNFIGETGVAIETLSQTTQKPSDNTEKPYSKYGALGYSFYGGVETQHFFTSRVGLGSGLGFSYVKSPDDDLSFWPKPNWRSVSIKIPVDMLLALGSDHHSTICMGFSAHINLLQKSPDYESLKTYTYNPIFWSVQAGYFYRLNSRFQLGIMLNRDITCFLKQLAEGVGINGGAETVNLITRQYFFTARVSVCYRLFGHNRN